MAGYTATRKSREQARSQALEFLMNWYRLASGNADITYEQWENMAHEQEDYKGTYFFWFEPRIAGQQNMALREYSVGDAWVCEISNLPDVIKSVGGL